MRRRVAPVAGVECGAPVDSGGLAVREAGTGWRTGSCEGEDWTGRTVRDRTVRTVRTGQ